MNDSDSNAPGAQRAIHIGTDQPAEWVRAMSEHYTRTGTVSAADVVALLGDSTSVVLLGQAEKTLGSR